MFGGMGPGELILVFLVVLLLFGAKRLPEIGSSLGKGIREFKGSIKEIEGEIKTAERRYTPPPVPAFAEGRRLEAAAPAAAAAATAAQPVEASAPQGDAPTAAQG